ncbi:hypothetical protein C8R46DRAFT_1205615 [Mycena filopes]|nr:hypothetical protein C8R46DRAFT_1205615 [Mycena filopes]
MEIDNETSYRNKRRDESEDDELDYSEGTEDEYSSTPDHKSTGETSDADTENATNNRGAIAVGEEYGYSAAEEEVNRLTKANERLNVDYQVAKRMESLARRENKKLEDKAERMIKEMRELHLGEVKEWSDKYGKLLVEHGRDEMERDRLKDRVRDLENEQARSGHPQRGDERRDEEERARKRTRMERGEDHHHRARQSSSSTQDSAEPFAARREQPPHRVHGQEGPVQYNSEDVYMETSANLNSPVAVAPPFVPKFQPTPKRARLGLDYTVPPQSNPYRFDERGFPLDEQAFHYAMGIQSREPCWAVAFPLLATYAYARAIPPGQQTAVQRLACEQYVMPDWVAHTLQAASRHELRTSSRDKFRRCRRTGFGYEPFIVMDIIQSQGQSIRGMEFTDCFGTLNKRLVRGGLLCELLGYGRPHDKSAPPPSQEERLARVELEQFIMSVVAYPGCYAQTLEANQWAIHDTLDLQHWPLNDTEPISRDRVCRRMADLGVTVAMADDAFAYTQAFGRNVGNPP